ncbi:MAG: cell division protein FtsA [Magnetovibrio sp.]|nr:cell division protein FtsA [Magnetovibrio sp.]
MKNETTSIRKRNGVIAAIDIGTTKICCLIAKPRSERTGNRPCIMGIGHQVSNGLRNGTIVDLDQAEASVRSTVEAAEQMAGENIDDVIVNLNGGQRKSHLVACEVAIGGHEISNSDIRRILDPSNFIQQEQENHELVHCIPMVYGVDGNRGISDPRGMFAERLSVNVHVVMAQRGQIRNLRSVVRRCHLGIEDVVVAPYATALGCLTKEEKSLGVTCIDMGGGSTSFAIFFDGELVHTDSLPLGGEHVTRDIARGLVTSYTHAERMKTLYGNAIPSINDDQQLIQVPSLGEEETPETNTIPRSVLVGIIRPRIEEIFELIRDRIKDAGFDQLVGRGMVLTGGASQLPGVREVADTILDKQSRFGRPLPMDGMAEVITGPTFTACMGLLHYGLGHRPEELHTQLAHSKEHPGKLGKISQWLRENF